jgi:glycosyltransferase involved in cell wall biosynthesis
VKGKTVLLTFGLLSSNKGIEQVIEALPEILKEHPSVVYIVLWSFNRVRKNRKANEALALL